MQYLGSDSHVLKRTIDDLLTPTLRAINLIDISRSLFNMSLINCVQSIRLIITRCASENLHGGYSIGGRS